MSSYKIDGCEVQSVTTIIGAQSDKQALIAWSPRMAIQYIEEFCDYQLGQYHLDEDDLEEAKVYYKKESERAIQIGSNVHKYIEEFLNARRKRN